MSAGVVEIKKRVKCRDQRRMVVHASLFGVGAPEVLVIGVVALLVFGPKGLAEVFIPHVLMLIQFNSISLE